MGLKELCKILLDTVYPTGFRCFVCSRELEEENEYGICPSCGIPWNDGHFCLHCGRPLQNEANYCEACMHSSSRLEKVRAALIYKGSARKLVRALKFGRAKYLMECIGPILLKGLESWTDPVDAVVPVPLSARALNRRGYNQAELMADVVAKRFGVSVLGCLSKIKEVKDQAKLSRADRLLSVRGCFACEENASVEGKRVLLVDDVMTTGATVEECAAVLSERNPASVSAFVFAVGGQSVRIR